jgi:nicotinate-nucleotide adenylyltransferase
MKQVTINEMQSKVLKMYHTTFGRTPLKQRLNDIQNKTMNVCRYAGLANLRDEAGDLLSSLLMLMNENGWLASDVLDENLAKIKRRMTQYQGMSRRKSVAILGGSFNPIHIGHMQVAKLVLDTSDIFDEIWLTPCANHVFHKALAPAEHRLIMCQLASMDDGRIKVFDYEIKNNLRGDTYGMVKRLLKTDTAKNEVDFSFVIGLDNANCFDKWINYKELEGLIRFVVVPRAGEKKKHSVNWYMKPPHIYLKPDRPLIDLSSTTVRMNLQGYWNMNDNANYFLEKQLHPDVYAYIREHKLYKPK